MMSPTLSLFHPEFRVYFLYFYQFFLQCIYPEFRETLLTSVSAFSATDFVNKLFVLGSTVSAVPASVGAADQTTVSDLHSCPDRCPSAGGIQLIKLPDYGR